MVCANIGKAEQSYSPLSMSIARKIHPAVVCLVTFCSLLPLQLLIFGDDMLILQGQLAGVMYTMVLIAFFCGSQWNNALNQQIAIVHISSLLLALLPWFLILARRFFNEEVMWGIMTGEVLLILAIDWIVLRSLYPKWYLKLRTFTSVALSISIALICLRKSMIY